MKTNPWLSAYMSAANRAYNMTAQSMLAQTRAVILAVSSDTDCRRP